LETEFVSKCFPLLASRAKAALPGNLVVALQLVQATAPGSKSDVELLTKQASWVYYRALFKVTRESSLMTTKTEEKPGGGSYLSNLLLGLLPLLVCVQLLGCITFFPQALRGHADFRQLYTAGYMVRTGHAGELYDYRAQKKFQDALVGDDKGILPFIRPAYQALFFVPFSLLPYRASYLAFLFVNLAVLAIAFWLLRPSMSNLSGIWQGLPVFVFLVFYPVALALLQGQDSILLLALLAVAWVSLDRGRELVAGFLVGLGLFKMQIVIPIALLFLLWRFLRFCAGFMLSTVVVSLVSVWVVGLAQTVAYARSLFSVGTGLAAASDQIHYPLRISIMANLRGLIFGLGNGRLSTFSLQALTIFGSIILLAAVVGFTLPKPRGTDAFTIAITASVIVSYYLFIHDLSVLLIPIAITLDHFINPATTSNASDRLAAWMAAVLLVAPMAIFLIPENFYLLSVLLCTFLLLLTSHSLGKQS
jgi:hypothetical protein